MAMKKNIRRLTQEERSIEYVKRFEKRQGRKPVDMSKKLIGYDVKSGNRYIEVKSRPGEKIQPHLTLYKGLLSKLGKNISHYFIYVVYDMDRAPKLVIIPPEVVFSNLEAEVKLIMRSKCYNKIKSINLRRLAFTNK